MAVTFNSKSAFAGNIACFQVQPVLNEVMGYSLENAPAVGEVVHMGTPIVADPKGKSAKICKYAVIEKKVDAKTFVVKRLGFLAAGDSIFVSGGSVLSTIASIDEATRTIVLKANNAEIEAGKVVLEGVSATVDGAAKLSAVSVPNRIVSHSAVIKANDKTVSAAFKAVAIQNVLNYPDEWLNTETFPGSTLLKGNPHVFFVIQ